jgi:hypothetical protein
MNAPRRLVAVVMLGAMIALSPACQERTHFPFTKSLLAEEGNEMHGVGKHSGATMCFSSNAGRVRKNLVFVDNLAGEQDDWSWELHIDESAKSAWDLLKARSPDIDFDASMRVFRSTAHAVFGPSRIGLHLNIGLVARDIAFYEQVPQALRDGRQHLRFVCTLPWPVEDSDGSANDWTILIGTIAHEYAHVRLEQDRRRNLDTFSEEVMVRTFETCVRTGLVDRGNFTIRYGDDLTFPIAFPKVPSAWRSDEHYLMSENVMYLNICHCLQRTTLRLNVAEDRTLLIELCRQMFQRKHDYRRSFFRADFSAIGSVIADPASPSTITP